MYCGAGTSGRLAVLDATELFPTFNWPKSRTKYLLAGGVKAIRESVEDAEDNEDAARQDAQKINLCKDDIVLALAASGTTPYTLEVVRMGNEAGALTIGFANKSPSPLLTLPQLAVFLDTGEEVLPGSSRLAAGTAQKMALNIFSTAIMVKLGKVYKGRMVDMRASNIKLRRRALDMVMELADCSEAVAKDALAQHNNRVKPAILSLIS